MYITWQTIITIASVLTSIVIIGRYLVKVHKWYLNQEKQDAIINTMKEEQRIIVSCLLTCLRELKNLGFDNDTVLSSISMIEDRLNAEAHK